MLLSTVRSGFNTRLKTIAGLETFTAGDTPAVPGACFEPPQTEFHGTMQRGSDDLVYEIRVFVTTADNGEATRMVEEYQSGHGTKSVRGALETTATGDGLSETELSVQVRSATPDMRYTAPGGGIYATVLFEVSLSVDGTT